MASYLGSTVTKPLHKLTQIFLLAANHFRRGFRFWIEERYNDLLRPQQQHAQSFLDDSVNHALQPRNTITEHFQLIIDLRSIQKRDANGVDTWKPFGTAEGKYTKIGI